MSKLAPHFYLRRPCSNSVGQISHSFGVDVRVKVVLVLVVGLSAGFAWAGGYALRVVQPGDSLGAIAQLYHLPVDALLSYNGLTSELLQPGDVLKIPYGEATGGVAEVAPKPPPGFTTHTLREGESLSTLASRYGLSLEALIGANPDLSSLDRLPAGIELLIPPSAGLVVTLQEGEDLLATLAAYDVSPLSVVKVNKLTSPGDLTPGTLLFLPGVKPEAALERLAQVREEENTYLWPLHGRITSYFGRRNLGLGTASFHRAIDIAAPFGTPITAARSGVVVYAGWSSQGYGNLVKLRHAGGAETWYAHFSKIGVAVGQRVEQGDALGLVGSTGLSTGPHLHFEVHDQGQTVDPLSYLP